MLDQATRTAILRLRKEGHGIRPIARTLGVSKGAVRAVVRAGTAEVPRLERPERADPHRDEILALYSDCKGNLVRVHEKITDQGLEISYQALTAFCRRHEIGRPPPKPAGRYEFAPGQEMQHDTSPHDVKIGGKKRRVQTASVVLCHSRTIFMQMYPTFDRLTCKIFLTDAVRYFGGACGVCMIDNTHVVVLRGTGREMVAVPEMEAFAERFGFVFRAHEKGDANRSARVERPMDYIERNFHAGREFSDWDDGNRRAVAWCDKVNAKHRRHLHASPRELFVAERPRLRPLPIWVPEVYALHQRIVDVEGYVKVRGNRYSVPYTLLGRRLEVRETKDRILVCEGPRQVAEHRRVIDPAGARVTKSEHRPPRGRGLPRPGPTVEEKALRAAGPDVAAYAGGLKKRGRGNPTLALRRLARMLAEYPRKPFLEAVRTADRYGLYDIDRLERMVLRRIAGDLFFPAADGRDETAGSAPAVSASAESAPAVSAPAVSSPAGEEQDDGDPDRGSNDDG